MANIDPVQKLILEKEQPSVRIGEKSVLDYWKFSDPSMLGIVGHCPSCGAPIYGRPAVSEGADPEIKYSCFCHKIVGVVHQK